ncbi:glycosyltransferase [Candidatus Woesearchaeota archaeon]|jgi:glycosyltransferase involved in cell wall biosynthesis|nr:glycosyltransferase [Candidatus Woesearchaeota archaeon]
MNEYLPKISIVICAFNVSKLIKSILNSLKQQTFQDFEVVIVNDGSTDDTSKVANEFGVSVGMGGVRVLDMPHQGLSATRNTGINNARADIVAIIDADCHATENWLQEIYKKIEQNGETVVTGNTKIPKSTFLGDCISGLGYPGGAHLGFENMWPVSKEGYTNHLAGGNCAFRKEIIQNFGAFNPKLTITADDVYLSMKILENQLKIKYNPKMIMYHPPRKDLKSFIHWHYTRGKGSYFFKKQVGSFNKFYKLRIWSTKNMIREYKTSPKLPVMLFLLGLSFATQKIGFVVQKVKVK